MSETATRPAAGRQRSPERIRFLSDLLAGAIEHNGYGFSYAREWHCPSDDPASWHAVIVNRYAEEGDDDYGQTWRVDLDTMAKGLGVIKRAVYATDGEPKSYLDGRATEETRLVNAETFEWLHFGGDARTDLLLADRTNGDDGDYDVIGALAVLECALFGQVVFA